MLPSDEYKLALEQVNKFAERRQAIATIYLSVNAALTAAVAFLFKDGRLPDVVSQLSVLALLFSGVIACGLWRRLIIHYSTLTHWWYEQIRTLESVLLGSSQLITKEYQTLYFKEEHRRDTRVTPYEISLTWLFTAIYAVFSLAIMVAVVLKLV